MEFFENPSSTREEILVAAYRALCRHGYADLTIQKIGEEFDKSTSLVYHHYDSKDELLVACLEFLLEQYEDGFVDEEFSSPRARLEAVIEEVLTPTASAEERQFLRALAELRGQSPHDERYRDHFTHSDSLFQNRIAKLVESGIEVGEFREVDADQTAAMLQTFFIGAFHRRATSDSEEWVEGLRTEIDAYLESRLYR